jgi:hypothetical protein
LKSEIPTRRLTRRSSRPRAVRWPAASAARASWVHVSASSACEGTRSAELKSVGPPNSGKRTAPELKQSIVVRAASPALRAGHLLTFGADRTTFRSGQSAQLTFGNHIVRIVLFELGRFERFSGSDRS